MSGSNGGASINSDLVIRARDLASEPIEALVKRIESLGAAIEVQSNLSKRGEGSAKALSVAIKQQEEAVKALVAQQAKLDQFLKTAGNVEKLKEAQQAAASAIEAFKEKLASQETVTKSQERELDKLERAYARSGAAVRGAQASLDGQSERLAKLGIDTKNLAAAQDQLNASRARGETSLNTGDLARLTAPLDKQQADLRAAEATSRSQAEASLIRQRQRGLEEQAASEAAAQAAATASLARQRQKGLSDQAMAEFNAEIKAKEDAEKRREQVLRAGLAVDDQLRKAAFAAELNGETTLQAAIEQQRIKATEATRAAAEAAVGIENKRVAEVIRLLDLENETFLQDIKRRRAAREQDEADREASEKRRMSALAAGQQALSQLRSPLGEAPGVAAPTTDTARALAAIIAPAAEARSTLAGVTKEVGDLRAAMTSGAQTTERYQADLRTAGLATRELGRQAQLIDSFKSQEQAARLAQSAFGAAKDELQRLTDQVRQATTVDAAQSEAVARQAAEVNKLLVAFERENVALTRLRAGLTAAGVNFRDLTGEAGKLAVAAQNVSAVVAKAEAGLQKTGGLKGNAGFLGLRTDELYNLSFQINDVFTSLASGISLAQTAAQQSGQIFQLFERPAVGAIARIKEFTGGLVGLPVILGGVAAAVGVLVVGFTAFSRALEASSATRNFEARLAATADSSITTGRQLTEVTEKIKQLGSSFSDAQKAVQIFLEAGVNPDRLLDFGRTAQNVADITGKTLPEAAKEFANSFTRGFDAVLELNKQFNFLTEATYNQIKATYDQEGATKGGTLAFNIFAEAQQRGADKANGEWSLAIRGLKVAIDDFYRSLLNNAAVQGFVTAVTVIVNAAKRAVDALNNARTQLADGTPAGPSPLSAPFLLGPAALAGNAIFGKPRPPATATGDSEAVIAKKKSDAALAVGERELEKQQTLVNRLRAQPDQTSLERELLVIQEKDLANLTAQRDRLKEIATNTAAAAAEERRRTSALDATRKGDERSKVASLTYADELEEANNRVFDGRLRGAAAVANKERTLDQLRKDAERAAMNRDGEITAAVRKQIDEKVALRRRELDEQIAGYKTEAQVRQEILTKTADAEDANLKGSAAKARDLRKREEEVRLLVQEKARALNQSPEEFLAVKANADAISAYRASVDKADERKRAEQDAAAARSAAAAGNKRLNAEESLQAELLAIKSKADRADKTNLEARLRSIDEEYDKIALTIAKARRAGVTSVAGQSFEEFVAAIEAQKDKLKADTTISAGEASINELLSQRKTEYAAINEELAEGTISVQEAFRRTLEVTSRLGAKIKEVAAETSAFAKTLPDQTPKLQAFEAKADRLANQSPQAESKEGVNGAIAASLKQINDLVRQRTDLESAERTLAKDGLISQTAEQEKIKAAYDQTRPQIENLVGALREQLAVAREIGAINDIRYNTELAKLDEIYAKSQYVSDGQKVLYKTIGSAFLNDGVRAFNVIGEKLGQLVVGGAKLSDVFRAAGQAFAQFAASFLRQIAEMILKALLLKAIQAAGNAVSPGLGDAISGVAKAATAHSGAVIGSANDNTSRPIDPAWFRNAPRFHTGGVVGLAPDERATILQTGEEVLSRGSTRNILNGAAKARGAAEGASRPIRQVLVFDPSQLSQALAGSHGEEVVLSHIKNNPGFVRQVVR